MADKFFCHKCREYCDKVDQRVTEDGYIMCVSCWEKMMEDELYTYDPLYEDSWVYRDRAEQYERYMY